MRNVSTSKKRPDLFVIIRPKNIFDHSTFYFVYI